MAFDICYLHFCLNSGVWGYSLPGVRVGKEAWDGIITIQANVAGEQGVPCVLRTENSCVCVMNGGLVYVPSKRKE